MLLLAACGGTAPREARAPIARAQPGEATPSNVLRQDYAGSEACKGCHAAEYASWIASPMHNMTRHAGGAKLHAPFDGATFHFKDDSARFTTVGKERFVEVRSPRYGDKSYRLTKVIGGHYREDFVGIEVERVESDAKVVGDPREELVLPVSYVFGTASFRYKGYSVMLKERDGLRAGPVWSKTCIFCHNTAPYFSVALGTLAAPGARAYQGEIVDALLPGPRRASFEVTDPAALREAAEREIGRLHGREVERDASLSVPETLLKAVDATRANFDEKHLLEVGIGCEACHGGSRAHVEDPRVRPSFAPRASFLRVKPAPDPPLPETDRASAEHARDVNRACARCHQVLFSGYPFTWEGGTRALAQGGSNINSGEARDFLMGGCSSEMSCVACHEPHAHEAGERARSLDATTDGDAVCLGCHAQFKDEAAQRAHTHHDPARAGGRCMACHMPKKNMSLDQRLTRYHRVGSPTEGAKVERDRPLECALCHTDKSVRAIVDDMQRLWNKHYDENALVALYGDLKENALRATLLRGKPHEQAVAIYLLGKARDEAAAPAIADALTHPYPIVRGYALAALSDLGGAPAGIDLNRDDAAIAKDARAWLAAHPAEHR